MCFFAHRIYKSCAIHFKSSYHVSLCLVLRRYWCNCLLCSCCRVSCTPILWLCVVCCSHASRRPGCFAVLCRSRCWIHSSSCSLQEWPCAELRPGAILIWCTVGSQHNPRTFLGSLLRESLIFRIMHSSFMLRCVMYRLCVHYVSS
jgi:hypothetical protein